MHDKFMSVRWVTMTFLVIVFFQLRSHAQQIQSLEHDTSEGTQNALIQVDADTYLLAYSGAGIDGFVKTFTISTDGNTITEVQSRAETGGFGFFNSWARVDVDTFALAYAGPGNDGFIKTFTIPADGSTITAVQSLEHEGIQSNHNALVQVDADTYALAYSGNAGVGTIKTFTISANGSTITEVQSTVHDGNIVTFNSWAKVDADTFVLAYAGGANDGFIKTLTISSDGNTITEVQSLEHDTVNGQYNSLVQVDADTYALAYSGTDGDGFIKTFSISSDGSTITEVQSLEHDTVMGQYNSLVQVDTDTYALTYSGADGDGFIKTFTISSDGSTITEIESLEHDVVNGQNNSLVQVDADTYALAYAGEDSDGFLKTFMISASGSVPVTLMRFSVE